MKGKNLYYSYFKDEEKEVYMGKWKVKLYSYILQKSICNQLCSNP